MTIRHFQVATILALAFSARSQMLDEKVDLDYDDWANLANWPDILFLLGMSEQTEEYRLLDVANADADIDGKTTLSEAADLLNALFFKVTPDDLTMLDDDNDGYLTNDEVKNFNVTKLVEIIDPGTNLRPRADKVFDFFFKHGVNISEYPIESSDSDSNDDRLDTDKIEEIMFIAGVYHFYDQSTIRTQLRWTACCRLLLIKNEYINTLFNGTDSDALSSKRFQNVFMRLIVNLEDKDFADTISASDIRNIKVNRWNIFWPTADANGMFPVGQVETFKNVYSLDTWDNNIRNRSEDFGVADADLDHDGFLNAHELHEWLGESDSALLDEYYVNVMIDGVQLLLKKVANLFEVYLNEK